MDSYNNIRAANAYSSSTYGGGLYTPDYQEGHPISPPGKDYLLLESGSFLELENGTSRIELER